MKEQLSTLAQKVVSRFDLESDTTDKEFIRDLATLEALHHSDPAIRAKAEAEILADLQELAHEMGVPLLDLDSEEIRELSRLSLREIENRLHITEADQDYGRTKFINVFPVDRRETAEELAHIENLYIAATNDLLEDEAQTEYEYNQLIARLDA